MKRIGRMLSAVLLSMVLLTGMLPASMAAATTQDQLDEAQQDKKDIEDKLDQQQDNLAVLRGEYATLKEYLAALNDALTLASQELAELETQVQEKEEQISVTEVELEGALADEAEQYEAMKLRIKFMYERGDVAHLELLLSATSFADFLNKSEYIEQITAYDRQLLEDYKTTRQTVETTKAVLEEEKAVLTQLHTEAAAKEAEAAELVQKTNENAKKYENQISAEEQAALEYEEELRQKENDVAALQAKLAEEIRISQASAAGQKRDLSEIVFAEGDLALLAAIIECEAGGESYTGKVAVGAVVINRLKSSKFPDTMVGVIYAPSQFSPVASGRLAIVLARGANASCYQAAQEAMNGMSPVGDCVYFRTPIPGLSGTQIGNHIFY